MTKPRAGLTELEGAILGVLRQSANRSAYHVRQIFLASQSAEWSGSAGAVYPAIRRLEAAGWLKARREADGRGTQSYAVTPSGLTTHDRWLRDVARATGPGMDPFRTRAALWRTLPPRKRQALLAALKTQLLAQRARLRRDLPSLDEGDTITQHLLLALTDQRLAWLAGEGV
jgi:DNA-binding PadR family transcriptional regulator